jgi:hypothetical protein
MRAKIIATGAGKHNGWDDPLPFLGLEGCLQVL